MSIHYAIDENTISKGRISNDNETFEGNGG